MDPFGGTPRCPRCEKLVYAAEQVMGPARKMYHKACLTCTSCAKRLDSYSLLEHDGEPYCKRCHVRLFATKSLRNDNVSSPTTSPRARSVSSDREPLKTPPRTASIPTSPAKLNLAALASPNFKKDLAEDTPMEPPAQPFSFPPVDIPESISEMEELESDGKEDTSSGGTESGYVVAETTVLTTPPQPRIYSRRPAMPVYSPTQAESMDLTDDDQLPSPRRTLDEATDTASQPITGFAKRVVPMSTGGQVVNIPGVHTPKRIVQTFTGESNASPSPQRIMPNYTGQTPSPRRLAPNFTGGSWSPSAAQRVECPRCGKAVYHAEQVNAVGKRWHKSCLRCTQCSTSLNTGRLAEKDGAPYCRACYAKVHGPAGAGYALVGKVG